MAFLRLTERELRVSLRTQRPVRARLRIAALVAAVCALFLLTGNFLVGPNVGRMLEQFLCFAGLYCVLRTPILAAGAWGDERRNQTLGLLFLSGLGAGEVFAGKVLGSALMAFTNLLALFPMLALPFLTGGVPLDVFFATLCELPCLMLFALSISLLASAVAPDAGKAVVVAFLLGGLVSALTPAIYLAGRHFAPGTAPSLWWWRLSPALGPALIWRGLSLGFGPGERSELRLNLVVTLCWAVMALASALFFLKRVWRQQENQADFGNRSGGFHGFVRKLSGALLRSVVRLETNPFAWLASRDHQPVILGWCAILGIVLAWLLCWAAWPRSWPSVPNLFITATLLVSVLSWMTRYTAAEIISAPRRTGAYELLLTTPLNPSHVVSGTVAAVRSHFRALAVFIFWLNLCMAVAGLMLRHWTRTTLLEYSFIWLCLLAWSWRITNAWGRVSAVMWASLNSGRPMRAVLRTSGFNGWSWIWIVYNLQHIGRHVRGFPSGSPFEVILISIITIILLLAGLSRVFNWRRNTMDMSLSRFPQKRGWSSGGFGIDGRTLRCEIRLIREFREIVREPLPNPNDPRFKHWNVYERFPWGWVAVQQQLHERLARR